MDLFQKSRLLFLAFCTLFFFFGCNSDTSLSCTFVPIETDKNPYPELSEFKTCGLLDGAGNITVNEKTLKQIWFNKAGLAEIRIHDGIYYINQKGKLARSHLFDNGADLFSEGLSRTISNNKFGFINKNLDIVIEPLYDFVFPFKNGLSIVCNGCILQQVGEHKAVVGGKWGKIDKNGKVVTEVKYRKDELEKLEK